MRIGGLTKALTVLVAIYIPLALVGVGATVRAAHRARDFLDGKISATSFQSSVGLGSNFGGLLVFGIAPLTMIWMFRMAQNARTLGRPGLKFAPGWAIGGWFTPPLVLYVVPWLMFRELWKASEPEVPPGDASWRQAKVSPIVEVWWVLFGLVPLIGLFTAAGLLSQFRNLGDDADIRRRKLAEQLDGHLTLNVIVAILGVLGAVAYLIVIVQLSRRHRRATGEP